MHWLFNPISAPIETAHMIITFEHYIDPGFPSSVSARNRDVLNYRPMDGVIHDVLYNYIHSMHTGINLTQQDNVECTSVQLGSHQKLLLRAALRTR